jgi:hypothetical protein
MTDVSAERAAVKSCQLGSRHSDSPAGGASAARADRRASASAAMALQTNKKILQFGFGNMVGLMWGYASAPKPRRQ